MARRGDIAGLAALAALGYKLASDAKKGSVPVEDRAPEAPMAPMSSKSFDKGEFEGVDEAVAAQKLRREADEADAFYNPPRSVKAPTKPSTPTTSKQTSDKRDLERGTTRGRAAEGPVKQTTGATYQRAAAPSGDLASQIPGSAPEGWQGGSGERVTGNEVTRNLANTASALGAATGAGAAGPAMRSLANLGMYGRGSKTAGLLENAATRQLANAPTRQITGPSKADLVARDRAARAAAREQQMLEENAARSGLNPQSPGYEGAARAVRESLGEGNWTLRKKGGTVKAKAESKPAAKGWGKARGARQAKYY